MDKKKQIEEMAKDIYSILRVDTMSRATASMLYDKDYRKSEDVAEEIFAEIEIEIEAAIKSNYRAKREYHKQELIPEYDEFTAMCDGKIIAMRGLLGFLAELKKKYTEARK